MDPRLFNYTSLLTEARTWPYPEQLKASLWQHFEVHLRAESQHNRRPPSFFRAVSRCSYFLHVLSCSHWFSMISGGLLFDTSAWMIFQDTFCAICSCV